MRVWHRDRLHAAISSHDSVRDAYPALLTAGDMLTRLEKLAGLLGTDALTSILADYSKMELRNEQWVRFEDAGDESKQRHTLASTFVDLPVILHNEQRGPSVLTPLIARADCVLRPSVWGRTPRHCVITGAPGNGKSTITRFLTQVYRSRFISGPTGEETVDAAMGETCDALRRIGIADPDSRRWPMRVELSEMANEMGPSGGPGIRNWLCRKVSAIAGKSIDPVDFETWLKTWPSLLIFDGLDEVTAPSLRERVIDELRSLVEMCEAHDADILIVVTTRPTGYTEKIMPDRFDQIDLTTLDRQESLRYALHVTQQRFINEPQMVAEVEQKFKNAIKEPAVANLTRTPLQVLVLTVILTGTSTLPTDRYTLFWQYFQTILKRESNKTTTHASFFKDNQDYITELHEAVGLALQIRCEGDDSANLAKMPLGELKMTACRLAIRDGYPEDEAIDLAKRVTEIATQRLVLLVIGADDAVEFDVRSLQELMAGRAIVNSENVEYALRAIARSPHWRNSWLFAAGRMYRESQPQQERLLDIVESIDVDPHWPGWLAPSGPEIAASLLDDGLAISRPRHALRLVDVCLRCLNGPVPIEARLIASALSATGARHALILKHIKDELRHAEALTGVAREVARVVMYSASLGGRVPGSYSPADLEQAASTWRDMTLPGDEVESINIGETLGWQIDLLESDIDEVAIAKSREAVGQFDDCTVYKLPNRTILPPPIMPSIDWRICRPGLVDPGSIGVLKLAFRGLEHEDWPIRSIVARTVASVGSRQSVGASLKPPGEVGVSQV